MRAQVPVQYLARYFDVELDERCGHCDSCLLGAQGVVEQGAVAAPAL